LLPDFKARQHQASAGVRGRQCVGVFVAFDERQIGWPGEVDRSDISDQIRKLRSLAAFGAGQ
jgi:hypothetical protein